MRGRQWEENTGGCLRRAQKPKHARACCKFDASCDKSIAIPGIPVADNPVVGACRFAVKKSLRRYRDSSNNSSETVSNVPPG